MATLEQQKPKWAGADLLSQVVNLLIHTPPLYAVMKQQARRVLIKTAEKNGVPWRQTVQDWQQSGVESTLSAIANPAVTYPDYYQVPFHAYAAGNLCWLAAFEAEAATYAMALRVWKGENLTWSEAQFRLRWSFYTAIDAYVTHPVQDLLDVGCSVGISTQTLYQHYTERQGQPVRVTGLDLSPYMLAIAQQRDPDQAIAAWVHAQAEATHLPTAAFDLITLQFVIHELPRAATQDIFQELRRILRPGGCLAIVDNDPKSTVIQNLPPVLFTLMKSTEPWSDDYYTFDVEAALIAAGFTSVQTRATDPRHRTILARNPNLAELT